MAHYLIFLWEMASLVIYFLYSLMTILLRAFYVIGLGDTEVSRSNVFLHSLSLGSIQRNIS